MDKSFSFKNMTKMEKITALKRLGIIVFGNLLLAFATSIFLFQCDIVSGGLAGIGIIIQNVFHISESIVVFVLQWLLFLTGWITLGKKFALETLIATIIYPLGLLFFTEVVSPENFEFLRLVSNSEETTRLVAALVGGALVGLGVALNLVGGGSTGGLDILSIILNKITHIKTSAWVFIIDSTIIIIGIFAIPNSGLFNGLIGVISAFTCSLVIEIIFSKQNNCYIANIISTKWEIINKYIQDDMKRGATIVPVQGGYQFNEYRMVYVAFSRNEQNALLQFIAKCDPSAFVTIVRAHEITGEGFKKMPKNIKKAREGKKNG